MLTQKAIKAMDLFELRRTAMASEKLDWPKVRAMKREALQAWAISNASSLKLPEKRKAKAVTVGKMRFQKTGPTPNGTSIKPDIEASKSGEVELSVSLRFNPDQVNDRQVKSVLGRFSKLLS